MLKNKRIDPRDTETVEWGELVSETKTCVEFEELPGRYGIRTSQIFNDAEIDVFVGEYETPLDRITSGNPSETEFYASGGMAYIIVNAAHVGQDIRADYYPGGSVLTAEVLASEEFKGPQGDTGPQGPAGPAGAPGDVSDVENVGAGVGVFKDISAGTARFKSLAAGANIDFDTTDPDEIGISVNSGSLVGDAINETSKGTIVDNDRIAGANSENSNSVVYWLFSTIKAAIFNAINSLTAKATPVGADVIPIGDSAAGYAGKVSTISQVGTAIKTAQRFVSSAQTITSAGTLTLAHGLGVAPFYVGAYLECTTANNNYAIGDKLYIGFQDIGGNGANNFGVSIWVDDTSNIKVRFGSQANVFIINDKSTGTTTQAVNTNWRLRVIAEA